MNGITSKKERGKSRTGISFERSSSSSRADFRFAPVNVLLLVAFYVAGLTVHINLYEFSSDEIRDIIIPQALEDAMSRQAQAERERQSRIILGTAETEIAQKFAEASQHYVGNEVARDKLIADPASPVAAL